MGVKSLNTKSYEKQMYVTEVAGKTSEDIEYIEIRHSTHVPKSMEVIRKNRLKQYGLTWNENIKYRYHDMLFVKQITHFKDGTMAEEYLHIKDFHRPVYVTLEKFRNHKQQKCREFLKKVRVGYTTDSEKILFAEQAIGMRFRNERDLRGCQYVYGTEVENRVLLKQHHVSRNQENNFPLTEYSVMWYDIETDTDIDFSDDNGKNQENPIILASLLRDYRVENRVKIRDGFLYVDLFATDAYMDEIDMDDSIVADHIHKLIKDNMPEENTTNITADMLKITYHRKRNEGDLVEHVFQIAHEERPDILTAWNAWFDISTSLKALARNPYRADGSERKIKDVICDPSVPEEYRVFKFEQAPDERITQAGLKINILPHKQVHTYVFPASFKVVDQMSGYYFTREGDKEIKGGYSIDNIAKRTIGMGKLKLVSSPFKGLRWHKDMVNNPTPEKRVPFKLAYMAYNVFDDIIAYGINKETDDLNITLPLLQDISEWESLSSGPSKTMNDLHFEYLLEGKVLATHRIRDNFDKDTPRVYEIDRKDWTITVDQSLAEPCITHLFEDLNEPLLLKTDALDIDQEAGYPSDTELLGMSEETVWMEPIALEGFEGKKYKEFAKGQILGEIWSGRFGREVNQLPGYDEVLNIVGANLLKKGVIKEYKEIPIHTLPSEVKVYGDITSGLRT